MRNHHPPMVSPTYADGRTHTLDRRRHIIEPWKHVSTSRTSHRLRYTADESVPAAAIREVDLNRKFYLSATELASKVGLTLPRSIALRRHLGVDDDSKVHYVFVMGSQRHHRYSTVRCGG